MTAVRITPTSTPARSNVEVDGVDISRAVRAVRFQHEEGHVAQVELELLIPDATVLRDEFTGVRIGPETRQLLIDAGWTPPEGEQ